MAEMSSKLHSMVLTDQLYNLWVPAPGLKSCPFQLTSSNPSRKEDHCGTFDHGTTIRYRELHCLNFCLKLYSVIGGKAARSTDSAHTL